MMIMGSGSEKVKNQIIPLSREESNNLYDEKILFLFLQAG